MTLHAEVTKSMGSLSGMTSFTRSQISGVERTEETPEHQSGVQIKFQFPSLRRHAQNIVKKEHKSEPTVYYFKN